MNAVKINGEQVAIPVIDREAVFVPGESRNMIPNNAVTCLNCHYERSGIEICSHPLFDTPEFHALDTVDCFKRKAVKRTANAIYNKPKETK